MQGYDVVRWVSSFLSPVIKIICLQTSLAMGGLLGRNVRRIESLNLLYKLEATQANIFNAILTQWTTASFDFHQTAVHKRTTMLAHCNLKQNMWLCSKQSSFFLLCTALWWQIERRGGPFTAENADHCI